MKRIFSAFIVLVFLLGVSAAYACGEKKSSAEAKATSVKASSVKSSCSSEGVRAKAAVDKSDEVSVAATQATRVGSNCGAAKAKMSGVKKASATGGCHSADPAAAQKASVKTTKIDAEYCAPSPDCPNPCVKEGATKAKMEKTSKSKSDGMAATSKIAAPEAETMK